MEWNITVITMVPGAALVDVHLSLRYWQLSCMYVCGVSSGLSELATKVDGKVGGVRMAVGAGMGVFVGVDVDAAALVCWMDAKAVPTALVIAVFGSTVAGAGWHAFNKTVARISVERSGCLCRIIS